MALWWSCSREAPVSEASGTKPLRCSSFTSVRLQALLAAESALYYWGRVSQEAQPW